jgi:hypothetical protein
MYCDRPADIYTLSVCGDLAASTHLLQNFVPTVGTTRTMSETGKWGCALGFEAARKSFGASPAVAGRIPQLFSPGLEAQTPDNGLWALCAKEHS